MKKFRLSYLILLAFLTLLTNCGKKTDLAIRYEMEKKLNEADRLQEQLSIKGEDFSESDISRLEDAYLEVADMVELPTDTLAVANATDERIHTWELAMLAYSRIGALYFDNAEDYEKAYGYFEKIINTTAAKPVQRGAAQNYLASCLEEMDQYKEAADMYDSLADGYPQFIAPENPNIDALNAPIKSAEMWQRISGDDEYFKRLAKARDYYNKLLPLFPDTPLEAAVLGKIVGSYLREGEFNKAVSILNDTRDAQTGLLTPRVLMILADIYLQNVKDYRKAEQTYREFLKHYPEDNAAGQMTMGLAISLYEQKKYTDARNAIKDIEKVPNIRSSLVGEAYFLTALCYEKSGNWDRALNQFDLIQATFPGSEKAFEAGLYVANYYYSKGQSKLANNKFEETAAYIKKYTNPQTSNALLASRAMGYLARCYTEMGDLPKTIETMEELYEQFPRSPEGRLAPLRLADLYENEMKDYQAAKTWLEKFIEDNSGADNLDKIRDHIKELDKK